MPVVLGEQVEGNKTMTPEAWHILNTILLLIVIALLVWRGR